MTRLFKYLINQLRLDEITSSITWIINVACIKICDVCAIHFFLDCHEALVNYTVQVQACLKPLKGKNSCLIIFHIKNIVVLHKQIFF